MTRHITILCDCNYINYATALIYSIKMNTTLDITIDFLCLDDSTYDIMSNLHFKINCYKESDILNNMQIIYLKNTDRMYYMYTLSSYFSNYIMLTTDCESVAYIDADICFHKDIKYLYDAFDNKDVGIFRHRFDNDDIMNGAGKFNVGIVYFKKSKKGKQVLDWWSDAVLYRKYGDQGLDTMGDQKYLDEFPSLCNEHEIFIDGNIGHGAPWNWAAYDLSNVHNYEITYKNKEQLLIFTHFSKFICDYDKNTYNYNWHGYYALTNNGEVYNDVNLRKLHDEYFVSLTIAATIVNQIRNKTNTIKIAAGIIVFESDYVLKQCIDQIYPFVDQILITEGPVRFWQDKGKVTSMDNTNFILDNYNDYDNKLTIIHGQFEEKTEECNSYINHIREDIEYLWQIDADEIYTIENILKIKKMLYEEEPTSVGVRSCTFYGGFNNYLTGFEQQNDNFLRIFKFMKGAYWKTHRPPTIEYPIDLEKKHISSDELFDKWGIQMHHYSYVFPTQVKYKIDYYANSLNKDGVIPDYYNQVYLKWVNGTSQQKIQIEKHYNGVHEFIIQRRSDCYTSAYNQPHPETIRRDFNLLSERFNTEILESISGNWKNKEIPFNQLELDKPKLLNNQTYPEHWKNLLYILQFIPSLYLKTFYDVSCRGGIIYPLLKNNNYDLNYKGSDFCEEIIQTAKNDWCYDQFYVKDIYDLCDFGENDVIYVDGLLDILIDSDKCLDFLLKLNAEYVILNRVPIGSKNAISVHNKFDIINVISYTYEEQTFTDIVKRNNYRIKSRDGTCFLLENNQNNDYRMNKMVLSWKNPLIPIKQVALHKQQISNNYPLHWVNLLKSLLFIENLDSYHFYEFGCGIGTIYKLLKDNHFDISYYGFDFSESMISMALKTWNYDKYFLKDIYSFSSLLDKNVILYIDGTIDIHADADKLLDFVLQLSAKYVILSRIQVEDERAIKIHFAYDLFDAIEYIFDKKQFFNIINDNQYKIIFSIDTLFLLEKK